MHACSRKRSRKETHKLFYGGRRRADARDTGVVDRMAVKVAHVVLSLQPGGLERFVVALSTARAMAGVEQVVVCLDEPGVLASQVEAAGHRVVLVPRRPGLDLRLVARLVSFFREHAVDVVHTHSLDPMFYGGIAARIARVPLLIHTQHNTHLRTASPRERLKFRLAQWLFDNVVAVSAETGRVLAEFGVLADRRAIILNGIDLACFRPQERLLDGARPDDALVIGTVARLASEKGLDRLIKAFGKLYISHRSARLVIAGDGPLRAALEEQVCHAGLSESVYFLGYRSDVEAVLSEFDLFVLPSLTEGIPLALLEAMAAGVPVLATAVGGVPEVVEDGRSGRLVPPDDVEALHQALEHLAGDPTARAHFARAARARVEHLFDLEAMARAYRVLYRPVEEPESRLRRFIKRGLLARLPSRLLAWSGGLQCAGRIALTFDDGPHPEFTPEVLDLLERYSVRATFFLIGKEALAHPELVARIRRAGHELASHSHTHPHFDRISWSEAGREIQRADAALGAPSRLFRPPYGTLCVNSLLGAWSCRKTVVMWNVDLKDDGAAHPEEILAGLVIRPPQAGDVVLYHAVSRPAVDALPALIERFTAAGLRSVTVSELLGS